MDYYTSVWAEEANGMAFTFPTQRYGEPAVSPTVAAMPGKPSFLPWMMGEGVAARGAQLPKDKLIAAFILWAKQTGMPGTEQPYAGFGTVFQRNLASYLAKNSAVYPGYRIVTVPVQANLNTGTLYWEHWTPSADDSAYLQKKAAEAATIAIIAGKPPEAVLPTLIPGEPPAPPPPAPPTEPAAPPTEPAVPPTEEPVVPEGRPPQPTEDPKPGYFWEYLPTFNTWRQTPIEQAQMVTKDIVSGEVIPPGIVKKVEAMPQGMKLALLIGIPVALILLLRR